MERLVALHAAAEDPERLAAALDELLRPGPQA